MVIPLNDDNPIDVVPWATYGLIALNIAMFVWQLVLGEEGTQRIIYALGFIPAVLFGSAKLPLEVALLPPVATLVTSQFVHGGAVHLAGNMLFLWVFGNNIEEALGTLKFVIFYLVCGVAAALGNGLLDPQVTLPLVGASGAISGALGAYLMLYPFVSILVVIPLGVILYPTRLSAYFVLGGWFVLQLLQALLSDPGTPGIAFWAHFIGFVAGALLVIPLRQPGIPLFSRRGVIAKGPWTRAFQRSRPE